MFESEIAQLLEHHNDATTVLDAYDVVMSRDKHKLNTLVADVWDELTPTQQTEIVQSAEDTYKDADNDKAGLRHIRELVVFLYVNRAPGEPFTFTHREGVL